MLIMIPSLSKLIMLLLLVGFSEALPTTQRIGSYNTIPVDVIIDEGGTYLSSIWAGALLQDSGVTSAVGTFTVPSISIPAGGDTSTAYCGGAWVGIDGVTNICINGGLMQSGVNWCIQDGVTTYTPWYEYWPAQAQQNFDNCAVSEGDQIQVTIQAASNTSGTATLDNLSNGGSASYTWADMSPALCFDTAEWVVEDFEVNGASVPYADYGTVAWRNATAVVSGAIVGASDAGQLDMVDSNGTTIAAGSINGNDVTIIYSL